MAAQTLIEAGKSVVMLDVGNEGTTAEVPDKDFLSIRRQEKDQYRYFIGKDGEGIAGESIGKGAQVTPPRMHMVSHSDELSPIRSENFSPVQSLGYGGLGIGWGLQCWTYSDSELKEAGLNPQKMQAAYQTVAERIGISGTNDEAAHYTLGPVTNYQPSPDMDRNHQAISKQYEGKKAGLKKKGFTLGRTPLALLTEDFKGRKKYRYHDMDYYANPGLSAWRPWVTVNELRRNPHFIYIANMLTLSFKEINGMVEVTCFDTVKKVEVVHKARKLILAASALNSARIVLRSRAAYDTKLPLLCNPYTYIPCLQPSLFGKGPEAHKLGYAQLSLFLDEDHSNFDVSVASLYSYQSLMLFRIVQQAPLNFVDAKSIMRYLSTGLVIMGVHHPDRSSAKKYLSLTRDKAAVTGDVLTLEYSLNQKEKAEIKRRENKFVKAMRQLRAYPLKRIDPGNGASIHYAGTLPFSSSKKDFSLSPAGRLHGTRSVYVADSSGFTYLPARGLTFTLLANAHLTAVEALKHD